MATSEPDKLTIVRYGHPALRQEASPVGSVTPEVRLLADAMVQLMHQAHGVGLAANQVGIPRRLFVVEIDGDPTPLVDPEIVSMKGGEPADEGCLSLPRLYGEVIRPTHVVVKARTLAGRKIKLHCEGLLARAICHEVDHLNGRLFVDRADESTLHWLVRSGNGEQAAVEPTTLEDALKSFTSAWRGERRQ